MSQPQQMPHSADELKKGYTPAVRAFEIGSIVTFLVLESVLVYKLVPYVTTDPWLLLSGCIAGYLFADFVSGFVHWMADSWGSVHMKFIGPALLRPFREHHVDPKAITRHDFVETNGNNCFISIPGPLMAFGLLTLDSSFGLFMATMLGATVIWIMGTNQFHKWSHLDNIPWWVSALQKTHIVLPVGHHDVHHTHPYDKHYCITSGLLNRPLNAIRFWRGMEWLVTATTGLLPRADDLGETAAAQLVAEEHPELAGKREENAA